MRLRVAGDHHDTVGLCLMTESSYLVPSVPCPQVLFEPYPDPRKKELMLTQVVCDYTGHSKESFLKVGFSTDWMQMEEKV